MFMPRSLKGPLRKPKVQLVALGVVIFLVYSLVSSGSRSGVSGSDSGRALQEGSVDGPILVSYSYFQKDDVQEANFDYFITIAMGVDNVMDKPREIDFVVVQSGEQCAPCARLAPLLSPMSGGNDPGVTEMSSGNGITLLRRSFNLGMDFAAHNTTLTHLIRRSQLSKYRYVFFLNSSIRGPFWAPYMPSGWQWTRAFTDRMRDGTTAVGSSVVCLPEVDAGGFGPKLESWAFAVDRLGLDALLQEDLFQIRTCKLCADGVVVKGEYGITEALLKHGQRFDTLMARYRGVDWSERANWHCNDNVHPSRHGTYDGIDMHPYEVVFVKASWNVGQPHLDRYTDWTLKQAAGANTAAGQYDEKMYYYAISERAQQDHGVAKCFRVLDDAGNAI